MEEFKQDRLLEKEEKQLEKAEENDKMDKLIFSVNRLYDRIGTLPQHTSAVDLQPEVKVNAQMSLPQYYKITMMLCVGIVAIFCLLGIVSICYELIIESI